MKLEDAQARLLCTCSCNYEHNTWMLFFIQVLTQEFFKSVSTSNAVTPGWLQCPPTLAVPQISLEAPCLLNLPWLGRDQPTGTAEIGLHWRLKLVVLPLHLLCKIFVAMVIISRNIFKTKGIACFLQIPWKELPQSYKPKPSAWWHLGRLCGPNFKRRKKLVLHDRHIM